MRLQPLQWKRELGAVPKELPEGDHGLLRNGKFNVRGGSSLLFNKSSLGFRLDHARIKWTRKSIIIFVFYATFLTNIPKLQAILALFCVPFPRLDSNLKITISAPLSLDGQRHLFLLRQLLQRRLPGLLARVQPAQPVLRP